MTRLMARRLGAAAALAVAVACSNSTPTSSSSTTTSTAATPITTPATVTFTGVLGPGGTASRTFVPRLTGTASATLGGISPATALGLALGVPKADGTGCLPGRSAIATDGASAQLSAAVDVGTYCAQVFAPAQSAQQVTFTVTITYP